MLRVESFVGIAANEAAQAVRRAGLKPGLERSFGCEPGLTGRVVAQEPEPGAELARNGLVTLYVAAPAATAEQASTAVEQQPPTQALAPAEPASSGDAPAQRRKPGRLDPAPAFDIPPAPRLPGELGDARRSEHGDDVLPGHGDLDELGETPDEYVIAADELFARGGWRASRRPALAALPWLGERLRTSSKLLRVAVALLALWLLVAHGALLLAHGASRAPRPSGARAPTPAIAEHPQELPHRDAAPPKRARRPRRRARQLRAPRHAAHAAARRVARTPTPSSPSPASQPPAPSSSTPAPRHEGGLFSP